MRVLALLLLSLGGCVRHLPPPPPPARAGGPAFVDLEAGWRVRVITPKLKSGGFLIKTSDEQVQGNTITMRVGDEFLGYETAFYGVEARKDGSVRVSFTGVEFHRDGAVTNPAQSFAPRMRMAAKFRRVRLLYMQKVSDADHAMAVLAAPDSRRLAALTSYVQAAPDVACRTNRNQYCEWIPAGVAIRPERPNGAAWVPAR